VNARLMRRACVIGSKTNFHSSPEQRHEFLAVLGSCDKRPWLKRGEQSSRRSLRLEHSYTLSCSPFFDLDEVNEPCFGVLMKSRQPGEMRRGLMSMHILYSTMASRCSIIIENLSNALSGKSALRG